MDVGRLFSILPSWAGGKEKEIAIFSSKIFPSFFRGEQKNKRGGRKERTTKEKGAKRSGGGKTGKGIEIGTAVSTLTLPFCISSHIGPAEGRPRCRPPPRQAARERPGGSRHPCPGWGVEGYPCSGLGDRLAILSAPFPPLPCTARAPFHPSGPPHTLTSTAPRRSRLPFAPPPPSATMLRDGAAPLPLPRAARKGSSANARMTQQARPGVAEGPSERPAAPRPPPRRPPTERRGPGYLVCPGAASADAPCLPPPGSSRLASLQLSAEAAAPSDASSAASAAEPLPAARGGGRGTTFSWRRGPAGARARPGPAGGPCPGCRPPRSPRRGPERGPLAALGGAAGGGRYPSAGVVTSGSRECPPSGRPGGGRGAGRWWHRRRGSDPARHRGAAAASPLRGGRASGDPARCPPLPGCHGDRPPASQNGGGGAARGRRSLRRPGMKEGRPAT